MKTKTIYRLMIFTTVLLSLASAICRASSVPALAGTYANLSFNVDGMGGQNRLMPRLELRRDQTYRWGRESGSWQLRDGKLYFSGTYAQWGPGYVDQDRRIWFQFTKNGKHFTVTMYRVDD